MPAGHAAPVRVDADAPGAPEALAAAVASSELVLVHREGTVFVDGAVERLVRHLHRPHRRLVRVHSAAGPCYLARSELLATALRHGVGAADLVADAPGLDRRIAEAADLLHVDGPTPVEDPAAGRWRTWVDGAVVGVGAVGDEAWSRRVAREHSAPVALLRLARRRVGRARREVARRRQRPDR
ncbi:hypothetical protein [Janibacter sp. LM]|uniref:hypothetical protein n=1 Tax=Janibacter sp. LM TaxID=3144845 RepID=UPI0031F6FA1F